MLKKQPVRIIRFDTVTVNKRLSRDVHAKDKVRDLTYINLSETKIKQFLRAVNFF